MITIIENKGYLYNIRTKKILELIPEIKIVYLYSISEKNLIFKIYRRLLRLMGIYNHINRLLLKWKLRTNKYNNLMISFSCNFLDIYDGNVILDIDDPKFDQAEITAINSEKVCGVIVTTEQLMKIYKNEYEYVKPMYVIPTPIDIIKNNCTTRKRDNFIIGYFSAIISKDELNTLVKIAQYMTQYRDVVMWIIGKTETRHICSNIRYFGYLPHEEMIDVLKDLDIGLYIRTNDLRGRLSIKILEYMSLGIPIVSTDVTESFPVSDADAGYVCNITQLTSCIERLYLNKKQYNIFSLNAKKYASKYDSQKIRELYINLVNNFTSK